ncbi:MAG: argininosuccinate synthase [Dehalococcoidia bacterium]|jgi:hypothetical protein
MRKCLAITLILVALCLMLWPSCPALAADPTTEIHVIKYAADGTTVVDETTVDYLWMEANLPVQGDGVTHYYHQGPVFDETMDKWDPDETTNYKEGDKDKGAVRGTDIKDLCDLVGGMSETDTVVVSSPDGYSIEFAYENIYQPQDRQGPIVLCWYSVEDGILGQNQESGYPPRFFEAMQIVFMPKTTNSEGLYVFGNWDMHECLPEMSVHFYSDGSQLYPSTNGLSAKWVDQIVIYPEDAPDDAKKRTVEKISATSSGGSNSLPLIIGVSAAAAIIVLLAVVLVTRRKRS